MGEPPDQKFCRRNKNIGNHSFFSTKKVELPVELEAANKKLRILVKKKKISQNCHKQAQALNREKKCNNEKQLKKV